MDIRLRVASCRGTNGEPCLLGWRGIARSARLVFRLSLIVALATGWSAVAHAEWRFDASTGVLYDSNLTQAQQAPDIRADTAVTLLASGGYFFALTGEDALILEVNAAGDAWHRFHGLDQIVIGATASYRHKFGVGYAVPWLSLAASVLRDDSRSDIRVSDAFQARAELGQRFTEAVDGSIGVAYDRRRADNDLPVVPGISGKVFDLRGQSAFVRAAYSINEQLQLGANFAVRHGDVVSTTRQNLAIFLASDAIAADTAFGDDFFAYRLKGTTQMATVSSSWALSDRSSLNLRYADDRTRAYDGLDYRGYVINLTFTYNY
jgi:hypothetical protein